LLPLLPDAQKGTQLDHRICGTKSEARKSAARIRRMGSARKREVMVVTVEGLAR
jgi:hypothetical protein